jgi:hypothetical protein
MDTGSRLRPREDLKIIRARFLEEFAKLDDKYKKLKKPELYPVAYGSELEKLQYRIHHEIIEKELGDN